MLENAAARERGAQVAEDAGEDRPRIARHVDQLDHLAQAGVITIDQSRAGARFARDYERSQSPVGRNLISYRAYEVNMPKPPSK